MDGAITCGRVLGGACSLGFFEYLTTHRINKQKPVKKIALGFLPLTIVGGTGFVVGMLVGMGPSIIIQKIKNNIYN